jgi:hypothetical protein
MSRKQPVLAILVTSLVVCATAVTLYARSQFYILGAELPQVAAVCPGSPGPSPPGVPAITPRNDCTPSFTEQDVRDYVSHLHGLFKIGFVGQPTITHIWFITSEDAATMTNDTPSNLGSRMVCYVELRGTFTVDAPSGRDPEPTVASGGSQTAFIIFDAHTGNWLEAGAG